MTTAALSTSSNAALPAGLLRRRTAQDSELEAANGHAAGILFVAPDGDILLLHRASTEPNYGAHWSLPGGKAEKGEAPGFAADRETKEEIGEVPPGKKKILDQKITPTGMAFHTFAQAVPSKFVPKLNAEHSGYTWASLDKLPGPLHPAVEQTLKDRLGMADDMKPDDWKGLRDGFLKWAGEEETEAAHAADDAAGKLNEKERAEADKGHGAREDMPASAFLEPASRKYPVKAKVDGEWKYTRNLLLAAARRARLEKDESLANRADEIRNREFGGGAEDEVTAADEAMILALDRESVRTLDKDGRLHIEVAHISKAMVCPYKGSEIPNAKAMGLDENKIYMLLRDPEELRKAAPTFNNQPVLSKHIPVTAPNYDQKIKPYIIGSTGTDCTFESPYLDNSLVVWSGESIKAIDDDEQKEISCGYHYRAEMTPGKFDGTEYDGVMREIVGNHVALVKDGRAGPDVVVGDSTENLMSKPTRIAALTLGLAAASIAPLLAMDSKVTLSKGLFNDFTTKNFKTSKAALLAGVRTAIDGKLRKGLALDASMEGLAKAIDTFADMPEAMDEPLEENAAKKVQADVEIEPVKEEAGVKKPAFDAEPLKAFLKEKGMGDADIKAACDMVGGMAEGEDENDPEAKKAAEEKLKKAEDEAKTAKDAMKDMVTKPAMDAALKTTAEATAKTVRETERGIRIALAEVRPYVGELAETLAFDSGDDVRRHALTMLGVEGAKTMHPEALKTVLSVQRKPGARPVEQGDSPIAMDAATAKSFNDRFGTARIGVA